MALGLRDKALAERRKSGPARTFTNWLNGLDPEVRDEVVDLLNDEEIDGSSLHRALRQADIGYTFADAVIGKWRRGEYEYP